MSLCTACDDIGIVPFVPFDNPKPDADITADDLCFAVCLCDEGQHLRLDRNEQARTVPLWRVWAAREQIDTARVCLVEQVFTVDELTAAGLAPATPLIVDRRAALLAEGNRKR